MTQRMPIKLNKDPILEAIFELRFDSNVDQIAELLPGILFTSLKDKFPKIEPLPTARIPVEIRKTDPNLLFKPTSRLLGKLYSIAIGEKVVSLNCQRPYQGWDDFKGEITILLDLLKKTNMVDLIRRFSVKYINIISVNEGTFGLEKLDLDIRLGDINLISNPTSIRTEFFVDSFMNIVSIVPRANAKIHNTSEHLQGIILDIDTIFAKESGISWDEILNLLDHAHNTEKDIFYGVLKKDTIESYGPVWG